MTRSRRSPKPFVFSVKSTDKLSFFEDTADYLHVFSCGEKEGKMWMEKILVARVSFQPDGLRKYPNKLLISLMFFIKNATFFSTPKLALEIQEDHLPFLVQQPENSLFHIVHLNLSLMCHFRMPPPLPHMAKKFSSLVLFFMASHDNC